MINLGDKVKDTISGYSGIAVAKVTYLQGCDRFAVQAPVKKNEVPQSWQYFDGPELKVIKRSITKQGNREVGGYKPDKAQKTY